MLSRAEVARGHTQDPWLCRMEVDAFDTLSANYVSNMAVARRAPMARAGGRSRTSERAKSWRCMFRDMLAGVMNETLNHKYGKKKLPRDQRLDEHESVVSSRQPWCKTADCTQGDLELVARSWVTQPGIQGSESKCATCLDVQPHVGQCVLSRVSVWDV